MHCRARYLFYTVVSALAAGQMMAACGQKGDLYLPEKAGTTKGDAASADTRPDAPRQPVSSDAESLDALDNTPTLAPPAVSPSGEGL